MLSQKFDSVVQKKLKRKNRTLTLLTILLILLTIPFTVIVLQEEQNLRQEAAKKKAISLPVLKSPGRKYWPKRISVKFKKNRRATVQSAEVLETRIKNKFKPKRMSRHDDLDISELEVTEGNEDATVAELRKDPDVERADRIGIGYALLEPNDTDFAKQYGMSLIQAPSAWDKTQGSESVVIAIVDSGVDESHPELQGKITSGSKVFHPLSQSVQDNHGHGSHVAGIAAAITNNSKGVAGVCPKCKILNVKALDPQGSTAPNGAPQGDDVNIAKAIRYAADQGAKVINMSFAFDYDPAGIREAIDYAYAKGAVLVAGAGNNGNSSKIYPAAYDDKVIAVGAVDANDNRPSFSNFGSYVDVAAPGVDIWSTYKNSQLAQMSGTSMASPHVAGLAGLLASQGLSQQEIRNQIEGSTDSAGGGNSWQHGRINAAGAVGGQSQTPPINNNKTTPAQPPLGGNKNPNSPPTEIPASDTTPSLEPCVTPDESGTQPTKVPRSGGTSPKLPGGGGNRSVRTPNTKNTNRQTNNNNNNSNTKRSDSGNTRKTGSLYERVMRNAQNLRQKFFGARIQSEGETATVLKKIDPCNPDQSTTVPPADQGNNGRQTPGNQRTVVIPQPTKVEITIIHTNTRSGQDGQQNVSNRNGQNPTQRIVTRTCTPARVTIGAVRGGNVTIIPAKDCVETTASTVSIIEYNYIIDCYSDIFEPRDCDDTKLRHADLNSDGKVNQVDYNMFLKKFAEQ